MRAPALACTGTRSSPTWLRPTFTPNRHTSAAVGGRGTPGLQGGCIGPGSSGSWDSVCGVRCCISTPVSRARGRALRLRSAITRRATTSSSKTHTAWREGWRLWRSMAYRSRAACLFRSPMTVQRTRCAWSLGQRPLVLHAVLPYNGEKQTTARSHHRQHRVLVQDSSVQIRKNVAYGP
jgi:hypothetical protein